MDALIFPLEGPLMSLQGSSTDGHPDALEIPTQSMVAGLIGCALGVSVADATRLEELSRSHEHAVVVRRRGSIEWDFQKARLKAGGSRVNVAIGPTGLGIHRPKTSTGAGTVQLQTRPRLADAAFDIVLVGPELAMIREALLRPRWPLYLGRNGFLPSRPLDGRIVKADCLLEAARGAAPSGSTIWIPSRHAAPVPGDCVQMLPRRGGGVSLWTRLPVDPDRAVA